MHEIIDIYTKLVIAIISFIAPLIIHLLSMFSDGIAHLRRKSEIELQQMAELLKKEIDTEGVEFHELVQKSNKRYEKRKSELNKQLRLLSPKLQIVIIFPTLFFSLVLLVLYHLSQKDNWIPSENFFIRNLFFILSFISALIGIIMLKNVAWAVIDVKEELAKEKEQAKQPTERVLPIEEKKN